MQPRPYIPAFLTEAANPNIKVKLEPIIASEGDYYTKLDLMMRSASTAPDLVREDSFLVSFKFVGVVNSNCGFLN